MRICSIIAAANLCKIAHLRRMAGEAAAKRARLRQCVLAAVPEAALLRRRSPSPCPGASAAPAPSWSAAHFDHHGTLQREIGALTGPASTSTPATAETVAAPREKTNKKT
jgi:hypothetical protein